MIRSFKHLSLLERGLLYSEIKEDKSLREIAKDFGRGHTSLPREVNNNSKYGKAYVPCRAHKRALRVGGRQRHHTLPKDPAIFLYVRTHLRSPHFWTPGMTAGRISLGTKGVSVCVETVYSYIYSRPARRDKLWEYLPTGRKVTRWRSCLRLLRFI